MRAIRHLLRPAGLLALLALLAPVSSAQLDLPKGKTPAPRPERPKPGAKEEKPLTLPGETPAPPPVVIDSVTGEDPRGTARRVYTELARRKRLDAERVAEAVAVLIEHGAPSLDISRARISERKNAPTLVVAGRHLLRAGSAEDRTRVALRLQDDLPSEAAAPLVDELARRDPVLATPTYLAGLLDHPQGGMRSAVHRLLRDHADASLVPALVERFGSKRSATRRLVVELAERIDDPSAIQLLLRALEDGHASVARRAAKALSESQASSVDALLVETIFANGARDRRGAYAQLALADREDREQRALLDESGLGDLRSALASSNPLVAGAAAVSLAGIGFRSPASREMAWLDREVPHFLIRYGTGVVYHNDLSSLADPALRRMALLSGESFGADGAAWQRWWLENADGFVSRRATLDVRTEEIQRLAVEWRQPGKEPWLFLGLESPEPVAPEARLLFMGETQMRRLVAFLRGQRVFETVRLPVRPQATNLSNSRQLLLRFEGIEKHMAQPAAGGAPWFAQTEGYLADVVEENRWQVLFDRVRYDSQRAFFEAERDWWESAEPGPERTQRLKDMSLARLLQVEGQDRIELADSLEKLYGGVGVPRGSDFPVLLALLEDEPYYGPQARRYVRMCLASAAASGERAPGGTVDMERGDKLFRALVRRFGNSADEDLPGILEALGSERRLAAADDPDPAVRIVAARVFANSEAPADKAVAMALLQDRDPAVELAVVEALGVGGVPEARPQLLVLAREGESLLRAAALRALGRLGGEGVLDLCMEALGERDPKVQEAAVEALADLQDPDSVSLMGALFARGPDSNFFAAARRGLLSLGDEAEPELLRLARTPQRHTRRAAVFALAERGSPEAASLLMTLLSEDNSDPRVTHELAVLTCVDLRQELDPSRAWWAWWDEVVHDDSLSWLRAAAERQGHAAPPAGALQGQGTLQGALFLVDLVERGGYPVEDRARRELSRLLGSGLPVPDLGEVRSAWLERLRETVVDAY